MFTVWFESYEMYANRKISKRFYFSFFLFFVDILGSIRWRLENMSSSSDVAGVRYKDKVTIVTGGSRGIGQACVEVFGE